ncbi:acetyltransferase (GNAT) family protein [Paucimonas lemoignei]|uniref:Acetyltransferase (GNAT) family protein n=1 Tax=Paucimonas lemoignei TaxID=29443 RepID=A0A4R3HT69_PAULE|nr:GNAT family N-acetyltransferase [Paucimonas lemoignei]TCS36347.1 acetyltransferase (GNAT) family protein [Paucimonas lemoignei]
MRDVPLVQVKTVRSTEFLAEKKSDAIYLNDIPQFVEGELQRLYGHIYSSLPYVLAFESSDNISTYVARQDEKPSAILLFRLSGRRIDVLNHTMQIDPAELRRFASCMFKRFPSVEIIRLNAVHTDLADFPYPVLRGHAMEDIVIDLPDTVNDYTARLGKATRHNLKRYQAKLKKNFFYVSYQSYEKNDIEEQIIYDLIRLSEARVTAKNINFGINGEQARRMVELAKSCGVVDVIWVDGQLCAGSISFRIGTNQKAEVIAHDEKYNDYSPGMLCYYHAICQGIHHGVKKYHMGGGRLDYKVWLSGVQQNMEQVEIYRSYAGMALNCDCVAETAFKAGVLRLKTWLRRHENSLPVRLLLRSRHAMRR